MPRRPLTQTTKLTLEINLDDFPVPGRGKAALPLKGQYLDLGTGLLTDKE